MGLSLGCCKSRFEDILFKFLLKGLWYSFVIFVMVEKWLVVGIFVLFMDWNWDVGYVVRNDVSVLWEEGFYNLLFSFY